MSYTYRKTNYMESYNLFEIKIIILHFRINNDILIIIITIKEKKNNNFLLRRKFTRVPIKGGVHLN